MRLLVESLAPLGFKKKGYGLWKLSPDRGRFAGLFAHPRPQRGGERMEFCVITMGGWAELHELCWPPHLKPRPFTTGDKFAHFFHDMLDPVGEGRYLAALWAVRPSTSIEELWSELHGRILNETLPAIEIMFNREQLIAELEQTMSGGHWYIRPTRYPLGHQIIAKLRETGDSAHP